MIDRLGRKIEYLRISITDRCNLRCIYCMPKDGINWLEHDGILRFEEIVHLVRLLAPMGIRKIRLTGGEPLVRSNLPHLISELNRVDGIEEINLTTNGILFSSMAKELQDAGLHGINFSLDTLDPDVFSRITRSDSFHEAKAGIDKALELGFPSIKINCIPIKGINEDEIPEIAALAKSSPVEVRFIELMPIGCGKNYTPIPMEQVYRQLESVYGSPAVYRKKLGNGPASYYTFPGFTGRIGFISAMTHEFCENCNRVRLTSDGYLKLCLHYNNGIDLRTPLRSSTSDEELSSMIQRAILEKPDHHRFTGTTDGTSPDHHNMNSIGG